MKEEYLEGSGRAAELSLRRQGGHSIPEVAVRMGVPLSLTRSSRLLEVFAFSRFEMDDLVVSVDILNAGNELGIEGAMTGEIVEVFVLACPPNVLASRLRSLLVEMLAELPIQLAFGGATAFTARFAFGLRRKQSGLEAGRTPGEFLWPLMFTQSLPTSKAVGEAGLFHAEAHGVGHVLQTWPALGSGQHDAYSRAAHALSLGCCGTFSRRRLSARPPSVDSVLSAVSTGGSVRACAPQLIA